MIEMKISVLGDESLPNIVKRAEVLGSIFVDAVLPEGIEALEPTWFVDATNSAMNYAVEANKIPLGPEEPDLQWDLYEESLRQMCVKCIKSAENEPQWSMESFQFARPPAWDALNASYGRDDYDEEKPYTYACVVE